MATKQKLVIAVADTVVVAGAGAVAYGAYVCSPAVGYIVGGLLAMGLGIMAGVRR